MIRIGEKKVSPKNGAEYPAKLDHFIFYPVDEVNAAAIIAKAREVYGDKPRSLRVKFHSDNPLDVFDANYTLWQNSGCLCKGNGVEAQRLDDRFVAMREERQPKTGTDPADILDDEPLDGETVTRVVCRGPEACRYSLARGQHGKPGCKQSGLLRVILPDMPGLGVWYLSTGSVNSIIRLHGAVNLLAAAYRGHLGGQEAHLTISPKQAIIPDTQKRTTVYVLNLTTEHSFNELAQIGVTAALPAPAAMLAHDGDLVDPETGEVLGEDTPDVDDLEPDFRPAIEDDPEVLRVMKELGFTEAKRRALITAAQQHGWTREQLLANITSQQSAASPAPRQAAPVTSKPTSSQAPPPKSTTQPTQTRQLF